ncbi:putative photosynthetic complex assembly protein 2 [Rhodoligotrophos appendicifer]|uniref:putative photosynthetic complex assembly protein PuhE n=1 Tax=Rhodoligotrophos appendicifer TaxID=987056 RepID=UPI001185ED3E|nr:putative photosynthetic complex assembly protein PuhE [Rhodoligotrophos appendicifer]
MTAYLCPILFALFVWWFSTGAIIYLDGLPTRTFKWSMMGATALFAAALYGLWVSADDTTVNGAYIAFASALLAWGWHEISFYMGYVTGPRKHACRDGCKGWAHFGHALMASLWHELAIIVSFVVILALTQGGANQIGVWTFVILWWMHESARLNVFLGVRNLNAQFLPEHLAYLKSFLNNKPMNLLFPFSVSISTVICSVLATEAVLAETAFETAGFTFLATMMALAILEHWFLVLPIPAETMWNWSMKSRETTPKHDPMRAGHSDMPALKTVPPRRLPV